MTAKPKRIPALQGGKSIKPGGIYWMRYVIPAMLFYVIFMAFPMLDSIRLSLYEGTAGAREFVGLDNYVRLFTDEVVSKRFWNAFGNNWIFFAYHMILQNALGQSAAGERRAGIPGSFASGLAWRPRDGAVGGVPGFRMAVGGHPDHDVRRRLPKH